MSNREPSSTGLPDVSSDAFQNPTLEPLVAHFTKHQVTACLVVAKRASGKSTLLRALLHAMMSTPAARRRFQLQQCVVFSSTSADGIMSDYRFLDPRRVIQGFQPAVLEKIIKYQAKRVKALKQHADRTGKPVRAPHVCIILDDVVGGAESVSRSGPLNWLYASGRHLAMSCILCTQSATVCSSPLIKTNCTLCLCGPLSPLQTRALWESTSGLTASFKEFMQWVSLATAEYGFGMFDSHASSTSERIHRIRASPDSVPEFRISAPRELRKKVKNKKKTKQPEAN